MRMPEKIEADMFAPCGMNCMVCYKHCYHKTPCAGCLNSDRGKPEHCPNCGGIISLHDAECSECQHKIHT